jgi:hypothetical protein
VVAATAVAATAVAAMAAARTTAVRVILLARLARFADELARARCTFGR